MGAGVLCVPMLDQCNSEAGALPALRIAVCTRVKRVMAFKSCICEDAAFFRALPVDSLGYACGIEVVVGMEREKVAIFLFGKIDRPMVGVLKYYFSSHKIYL